MHGMRQVGESNKAGQMLGPVTLGLFFLARNPKGFRIFKPKAHHALLIWGGVLVILLLAAASGAGA